MLERVQRVARNGIPNLDVKIARRRRRQITGTVELAAPHGTLVALKRPDPIARYTVPYHRHTI